MGLLRNSKIISAEGLKAVKKTPDLSSMKNSKYVDAREFLFILFSEEFVIYLSDECMPFNKDYGRKKRSKCYL